MFIINGLCTVEIFFQMITFFIIYKCFFLIMGWFFFGKECIHFIFKQLISEGSGKFFKTCFSQSINFIVIIQTIPAIRLPMISFLYLKMLPLKVSVSNFENKTLKGFIFIRHTYVTIIMWMIHSSYSVINYLERFCIEHDR